MSDGFVKSPTSALRFISPPLRRTASTSRVTRFARLDFGLFTKPSKWKVFYEPINIKVNNDFRNVPNFLGLNNTTIGGVNVSVTAVQSTGSIRGEMVLQGTISGFTVGGQELWIDEVCP
jgi:hypothetical protein